MGQPHHGPGDRRRFGCGQRGLGDLVDAGSSFLLKTSDSSVSFSQHLNHKMQVTGTLSDSGRSTTGTDRAADRPASDKPSNPATDRDASASGRVSSDDMKLPTLNVTAMKMVSPTCGTGS